MNNNSSNNNNNDKNLELELIRGGLSGYKDMESLVGSDFNEIDYLADAAYSNMLYNKKLLQEVLSGDTEEEVDKTAKLGIASFEEVGSSFSPENIFKEGASIFNMQGFDEEEYGNNRFTKELSDAYGLVAKKSSYLDILLTLYRREGKDPNKIFDEIQTAAEMMSKTPEERDAILNKLKENIKSDLSGSIDYAGKIYLQYSKEGKQFLEKALNENADLSSLMYNIGDAYLGELVNKLVEPSDGIWFDNAYKTLKKFDLTNEAIPDLKSFVEHVYQGTKYLVMANDMAISDKYLSDIANNLQMEIDDIKGELEDESEIINNIPEYKKLVHASPAFGFMVKNIVEKYGDYEWFALDDPTKSKVGRSRWYEVFSPFNTGVSEGSHWYEPDSFVNKRFKNVLEKFSYIKQKIDITEAFVVNGDTEGAKEAVKLVEDVQNAHTSEFNKKKEEAKYNVPPTDVDKSNAPIKTMDSYIGAPVKAEEGSIIDEYEQRANKLVERIEPDMHKILNDLREQLNMAIYNKNREIDKYANIAGSAGPNSYSVLALMGEFNVLEKKNKLHNIGVSYKHTIDALYDMFPNNEKIKKIKKEIDAVVKDTDYSIYENVISASADLETEAFLSVVEMMAGITQVATKTFGWALKKVAIAQTMGLSEVLSNDKTYDTSKVIDAADEYAEKLFGLTNYARRQVQGLRQADSFMEGFMFDVAGGIGQSASMFVPLGEVSAVMGVGANLLTKVAGKTLTAVLKKASPKLSEALLKTGAKWVELRDKYAFVRILDKKLGSFTAANVLYALQEPITVAHQNYSEAYQLVIDSYLKNYIKDKDYLSVLNRKIQQELNDYAGVDNNSVVTKVIYDTINKLKASITEDMDKDKRIDIEHKIDLLQSAAWDIQKNVDEKALKEYMVYTNLLYGFIPNLIEHNILHHIKPFEYQVFRVGGIRGALSKLGRMAIEGAKTGTIEFIEESTTEPLAVHLSAKLASIYDVPDFSYSYDHLYEGLTAFVSTFLTTAVFRSGGPRMIFDNSISEDEATKYIENFVSHLNNSSEEVSLKNIQSLISVNDKGYHKVLASLALVRSNKQLREKLKSSGVDVDKVTEHLNTSLDNIISELSQSNKEEDVLMVERAKKAKNMLNSLDNISKELEEVRTNKDISNDAKPYIYDAIINKHLALIESNHINEVKGSYLTDVFVRTVVNDKTLSEVKEMVDVLWKEFNLNDEYKNNKKELQNDEYYKALVKQGVDEETALRVTHIKNEFSKRDNTQKEELIDSILHYSETIDIRKIKNILDKVTTEQYAKLGVKDGDIMSFLDNAFSSTESLESFLNKLKSTNKEMFSLIKQLVSLKGLSFSITYNSIQNDLNGLFTREIISRIRSSEEAKAVIDRIESEGVGAVTEVKSDKVGIEEDIDKVQEKLQEKDKSQLDEINAKFAKGEITKRGKTVDDINAEFAKASKSSYKRKEQKKTGTQETSKQSTDTGKIVIKIKEIASKLDDKSLSEIYKKAVEKGILDKNYRPKTFRDDVRSGKLNTKLVKDINALHALFNGYEKQIKEEVKASDTAQEVSDDVSNKTNKKKKKGPVVFDSTGLRGVGFEVETEEQEKTQNEKKRKVKELKEEKDKTSKSLDKAKEKAEEKSNYYSKAADTLKNNNTKNKDINKDIAKLISLYTKHGIFKDAEINPEEEKEIKEYLKNKYGDFLGDKIFEIAKDAALDAVNITEGLVLNIIHGNVDVNLNKKVKSTYKGKTIYHVILEVNGKNYDIIVDEKNFNREDYDKLFVESIFGDKFASMFEMVNKVEEVNKKQIILKATESNSKLATIRLKDSDLSLITILKKFADFSLRKDTDIKKVKYKNGELIIIKKDGTKESVPVDIEQVFLFDIMYGTNLSKLNNTYIEAMRQGDLSRKELKTVIEIYNKIHQQDTAQEQTEEGQAQENQVEESKKVKQQKIKNNTIIHNYLYAHSSKEVKKLLDLVIKELGYKIKKTSTQNRTNTKTKTIYITDPDNEAILIHELTHAVLTHEISRFFTKGKDGKYKLLRDETLNTEKFNKIKKILSVLNEYSKQVKEEEKNNRKAKNKLKIKLIKLQSDIKEVEENKEKRLSSIDKEIVSSKRIYRDKNNGQQYDIITYEDGHKEVVLIFDSKHKQVVETFGKETSIEQIENKYNNLELTNKTEVSDIQKNKAKEAIIKEYDDKIASLKKEYQAIEDKLNNINTTSNNILKTLSPLRHIDFKLYETILKILRSNNSNIALSQQVDDVIELLNNTLKEYNDKLKKQGLSNKQNAPKDLVEIFETRQKLFDNIVNTIKNSTTSKTNLKAIKQAIREQFSEQELVMLSMLFNTNIEEAIITAIKNDNTKFFSENIDQFTAIQEFLAYSTEDRFKDVIDKISNHGSETLLDKIFAFIRRILGKYGSVINSLDKYLRDRYKLKYSKNLAQYSIGKSNNVDSSLHYGEMSYGKDETKDIIDDMLNNGEDINNKKFSIDSNKNIRYNNKLYSVEYYANKYHADNIMFSLAEISGDVEQNENVTKFVYYSAEDDYKGIYEIDAITGKVVKHSLNNNPIRYTNTNNILEHGYYYSVHTVKIGSASYEYAIKMDNLKMSKEDYIKNILSLKVKGQTIKQRLNNFANYVKEGDLEKAKKEAQILKAFINITNSDSATNKNTINPFGLSIIYDKNRNIIINYHTSQTEKRKQIIDNNVDFATNVEKFIEDLGTDTITVGLHPSSFENTIPEDILANIKNRALRLVDNENKFFRYNVYTDISGKVVFNSTMQRARVKGHVVKISSSLDISKQVTILDIINATEKYIANNNLSEEDKKAILEEISSYIDGFMAMYDMFTSHKKKIKRTQKELAKEMDMYYDVVNIYPKQIRSINPIAYVEEEVDGKNILVAYTEDKRTYVFQDGKLIENDDIANNLLDKVFAKDVTLHQISSHLILDKVINDGTIDQDVNDMTIVGHIFKSSENIDYKNGINKLVKFVMLRYLGKEAIGTDIGVMHVDAGHFISEMMYEITNILSNNSGVDIDVDYIIGMLHRSNNDMIKSFADDVINGRIDKNYATHIIQRMIKMKVHYNTVYINTNGEVKVIKSNRDVRREDIISIVNATLKNKIKQIGEKSDKGVAIKSASHEAFAIYAMYLHTGDVKYLDKVVDIITDLLYETDVLLGFNRKTIYNYVYSHISDTLRVVFGRDVIIASMFAKLFYIDKNGKYDIRTPNRKETEDIMKTLTKVFGDDMMLKGEYVVDEVKKIYAKIHEDKTKREKFSKILNKYYARNINDIASLSIEKRRELLYELSKELEYNYIEALNRIKTRWIKEYAINVFKDQAKDMARTFITGVSRIDMMRNKKLVGSIDYNNTKHKSNQDSLENAINVAIDTIRELFNDKFVNNSLSSIASFVFKGVQYHKTEGALSVIHKIYTDLNSSHMPSSTIVDNKRIYGVANTNMLWQTFVDEETMDVRNDKDIVYKGNLLYQLIARTAYKSDIQTFNLDPYVDSSNNKAAKWSKMSFEERLKVLMLHYNATVFKNTDLNDNKIELNHALGKQVYITAMMPFHQLSDKDKMFLVKTPLLSMSVFANMSTAEGRFNAEKHLIYEAVIPELRRILSDNSKSKLFHFIPALNILLLPSKNDTAETKSRRERFLSLLDKMSSGTEDIAVYIDEIADIMLPIIDDVIVKQREELRLLSGDDKVGKLVDNDRFAYEFVINGMFSMVTSRRFVEGDPAHYIKKKFNGTTYEEALSYLDDQDRNLGKRAVMYYTDGIVHLDKSRTISVYGIADRDMKSFADDNVSNRFMSFLQNVLGDDKEAKRLHDEYMGQDISDGISYTTWHVWLDITAQRLGMPTDLYNKYKDIFTKIDNEEELTDAEKAMFDNLLSQSLKEIVAWFDNNGNPLFLKTSTLPLTKPLAKALGLENIYNKMRDNYGNGNLPFVGHKSALKVFMGDVAEFNDKGDVDIDKVEPVKLKTIGMRIVLNKPSTFEHKGRSEIRLASQFMRMATGFIENDDKLIFNGNVYTGKEIIHLFNSLLLDLVHTHFNNSLYNIFGKNSIDEIEIKDIIDYIQRKLEEQEESNTLNDLANPILSNTPMTFFNKLGSFIAKTLFHIETSGRHMILASLEKLALIDTYTSEQIGSFKIRKKYVGKNSTADDVIIGPKIKLANGEIISLIDENGNIIEERVEMIEKAFSNRIPYSGHMSSHIQRIVGIDTSISTGDVMYVHPFSMARLGDDLDIDTRFMQMKNLVMYNDKVMTAYDALLVYNKLDNKGKELLLKQIGLSEHQLRAYASEDKFLDLIISMFSAGSQSHVEEGSVSGPASIGKSSLQRVSTEKDENRRDRYGNKETMLETLSPIYNLHKAVTGAFGRTAIGFYATSGSALYQFTQITDEQKEQYNSEFREDIPILRVEMEDGSIREFRLDTMQIKQQEGTEGDDTRTVFMRRENDALDSEKINVLGPLNVNRNTIALDIMLMFYGIDVLNRKDDIPLSDLINLSSAAKEWEDIVSQSDMLGKKNKYNPDNYKIPPSEPLNYKNLKDHVLKGEELSETNRQWILYLYHETKRANDALVDLFVISNPMAMQSFGIKEFVRLNNIINKYTTNRNPGEIHEKIASWIFYNIFFTDNVDEAIDGSVYCCGLYARTPASYMVLQALRIGEKIFTTSNVIRQVIKLARNDTDIRDMLSYIRKEAIDGVREHLNATDIEYNAILEGLKDTDYYDFFKRYIIEDDGLLYVYYDNDKGESLQVIHDKMIEMLTHLVSIGRTDLVKRILYKTLLNTDQYVISNDRNKTPMFTILSIQDMVNILPDNILSSNDISSIMNNIDVGTIKHKITAPYVSKNIGLEYDRKKKTIKIIEKSPDLPLFVKQNIRGKTAIFMKVNIGNDVKYIDVTNVKDSSVLSLLQRIGGSSEIELSYSDLATNLGDRSIARLLVNKFGKDKKVTIRIIENGMTSIKQEGDRLVITINKNNANISNIRNELKKMLTKKETQESDIIISLSKMLSNKNEAEILAVVNNARNGKVKYLKDVYSIFAKAYETAKQIGIIDKNSSIKDFINDVLSDNEIIKGYINLFDKDC